MSILSYNRGYVIREHLTLLCPYGITKGDLKLLRSKAPSRTIATKRVGKQTQLAQRVASLACKR
jgi:hypothetical protein